MGDLYERDAAWWRRARGAQRGAPSGARATNAAVAEQVAQLVVGDEPSVLATTDLEGQIGIFVETIPHPSVVVGARICLRVRKDEFSCVVVSVTHDPDEVVRWGVYLALESDDDRRRATYYFATRDAVFFEP